ncbi:DUF2933 domain-containing protein [Rossellomorea aquimaris]|uniref:DUF2933 family protein n=1 Tax=Rossellomorea aquimaris TaxID=189382 RepID=A0A366EV05_9BACI|nr:DUF2933 domain-containing protein [Rossellomorea aquimaris]RBP05329.1 DUF2933 family protein [Rossellomorea aquimaris]
MEWLIYLLCPLMMLFCLKGMFSGGKNCDNKKSSQVDFNSLQTEVKQLQEQNRILMNEVKSFSEKNLQKDKQIS